MIQSSGSQPWLHVRITRGACQHHQCQGPSPRPSDLIDNEGGPTLICFRNSTGNSQMQPRLRTPVQRER